MLAVLAALAVYFFAPHECDASSAPAALTKASIIPSLDRKQSTVVKMVAGDSVPQEFAKNIDILLKRLPRDVKPTHYTLKLMPFLIENNFTTLGNVTIDFDCVEATDKIYLHAVEIGIERPSIRIKYVTGDYFLRLKELTYNSDDQMYTFHLDRLMKPGGQYFLHMTFVSHLNDLNQGFYRSSYTDKETNTLRWIASSQFSPLDARRAFPCFDEPDFKATFSVSLARPNYMTTLSNMPRINTEDSMEMPGYSWDNYERSPNMSTYLVAFVVSDLQPYEFNTDGRSYRIWSRKDVISQSIYASQISPRILKYYEKYFDIKFPLPKLDQVAVPDFGFSAMENWGLITYRETSLLIDEQDADLSLKTSLVSTMSHELTHQWFGNLVTPKFWDDLFLKEGFANYFMYRGINHVEPSWNFSNELLLNEQFSAMDNDIYSFSRPLSNEMKSSDDIRQAFDRIAYAKGASIIHMLQNIYGEEHFKDSIKHYLNKHQYQNAEYIDFVQAFIERNPRVPGLKHNNDLKTILDGWIRQAGFPVVTVVADYQNNNLTLTQKRFRFGPTEKHTDDDKIWWIPVSYATKLQADFDDTKPKFWIEGQKETKVELDIQEGYLLNLKHSGYYIVNYDERNWKQITHTFKHFPLLVRSQLLANAMDLARANLLDYDIPFKLLITVGRWDNHFVPYHIAFEKVKYIYNMLLNQECFTQFNTFLAMVFDQSFANTLPEESSTDTYDMKRMRPLILKWACQNSESRCVGKARAMFRALMIYKTPVHANLQDLVYCTAIREGGETEFNFAHQMYLNVTTPSEKLALLKALGCTEQPWLLRKYLNMMLDDTSGVRKQDGKHVFYAVAKNIRGHTLAFSFLRENWDALKDYYGMAFNRLTKMIEPLSMYMNTPYDLEQLVAFGNSVELGTAKGAFKRVYEDVQMNIEWMKTSSMSVTKWLEAHRDHFGY